MKIRALAALTAVTMCTCLAACGNTAGKNSSDSAAGTTASAVTASQAASETSAAPDDTDAEKNARSDETDTDGNRITSEENTKPGQAKDADTAKTDDPGGKADSSGNGDDKNNKDDKDDKDSKPIITENMIKTDDATLRLLSGNILTMSIEELYSEPSDKELPGIIDAILAQYRAAEKKDLDAFIKTFRFADLAVPTAEALKDIAGSGKDGEHLKKLLETGQSMKYDVLNDMELLTEDLIDEKYLDELDKIFGEQGAENTEETKKTLLQAYSGINASLPSVRENIEYETIFDSEDGVDPIEGVSADSVYLLFIDQCYHDTAASGNAMYMNCELMIFTKDKQYTLGDITVYNISGEYGVFINDDLITEDIDKEAKGKTAEELFDMLKEEARRSSQSRE